MSDNSPYFSTRDVLPKKEETPRPSLSNTVGSKTTEQVRKERLERQKEADENRKKWNWGGKKTTKKRKSKKSKKSRKSKK